jgi:hypothetical protein
MAVFTKVVDMINPFTNTWDSFCDEDAQLILAIAPLQENQRDFITWHVDPKAIFSIKTTSAVGVLVCDKLNHMDQSTSGGANNPTIWSKIWGLQVINKIKMFL